jgi:hypothetical protein
MKNTTNNVNTTNNAKTDYQKGQAHFLAAKSVTDSQSFSAEFLNGYMFEERSFKIEKTYN